MAFRGRGRGRGFGRGSGGYRPAKQEPFVLFPEIENLPDAKAVNLEKNLVVWSSRLQNFWNSSPYYLKAEGPKTDVSIDIERFSDWSKRRTEKKHKLSDFIKCSVEYVPAELVNKNTHPERSVRRKVQWNQESDLQKLDLFEKREQKGQGEDEDEDEKGGKEKKEDENEEDDDERIEEDEEFSDDGDYNQNSDFQDDEDDFNDNAADNIDEDVY